MKYSEFFISSKEGKSNCVIRSFCKLYNQEYEMVFNDLVLIAKELNHNSFNDVEVFEEYMRRHDTIEIPSEEIKIKDLELDSGNYIVFCYDKKDFYHMITIIDNTIYDKTDECLDLYVIKIYKEETLEKKRGKYEK